MTTMPDIVTIPAFAPESEARQPKRTLRRAPLPRVRFAGNPRDVTLDRNGATDDVQPRGMIILIVK
ncbi:hypothetical protein [Opitutus terrae]|uniref:Uncharacterized protein n=1 Tax=Opitutus terrae (strain DSM 11246 / JCM 15787 / PB90-1) TaxID=452637 RepID=B1ZU30_OPITP|nr:hypothetical protein [Opitutus terrae]ACB75912.1 hypothetical protein Oter_2631 [Opitutus terrae PB90-1]